MGAKVRQGSVASRTHPYLDEPTTQTRALTRIEPGNFRVADHAQEIESHRSGFTLFLQLICKTPCYILTARVTFSKNHPDFETFVPSNIPGS